MNYELDEWISDEDDDLNQKVTRVDKKAISSTNSLDKLKKKDRLKSSTSTPNLDRLKKKKSNSSTPTLDKLKVKKSVSKCKATKLEII